MLEVSPALLSLEDGGDGSCLSGVSGQESLSGDVPSAFLSAATLLTVLK